MASLRDILKNLGQIAAEVQLAEQLSGHTNVTIEEIASTFNTIATSEDQIQAGKVLKLFNFSETESGKAQKIRLYAVLEGSAGDQAIQALL